MNIHIINRYKKRGIKTFFLVGAMLLIGGTASAQVVIKGNIYGGCSQGKMQNPTTSVFSNTTVTINDGTVEGSVYGGGEGNLTDEEKGWVQGNATVTMNGGTVERSIYGGGQLGSVGTFLDYYNAATGGHVLGEPTGCKTGTGLTTVLMNGGSVGVRGSLMPIVNHNPDDDDRGWIFCGGCGERDSIAYPKANLLAIVGNTHLEINGGLVTASVYGGSENGLVLGNTYVKITAGQIGSGYSGNGTDTHTWDDVYSDEKWTNAIAAVRSENASLINAAAAQFHECHAWPFGVDHDNNASTPKQYNVYDIYAEEEATYHLDDLAGGALYGSDGHSFFGNVFGGGSGYYPIYDEVNHSVCWRRSAGRVWGNTVVDIVGGHILTSVYGGNEVTDVMGTTQINMSGGTLGVPRTLEQIQAHPVTCYLFGAGMGDERLYFNTWTNVSTAEVNITGGIIFGSVFGGGEEGHVLNDVEVNIGQATGKTTTIGTLGYSYVDGNIFGGGRGFSGRALTAGSVGGNVDVNITGGLMLGSIYGGGRLASVGTYFVPADDPHYGHLQPDVPENHEYHGYITVKITGGTIGNRYEDYTTHTIGGNVFGGCMGRVELIGGGENPLWPRLAGTKHTQVNITGSEPVTIKGNVFGGPELGYVREYAGVTLNNSRVSINRIFGGGYGSENYTMNVNDSTATLHDLAVPAYLAGRVMGETNVQILSGTVEKNVFGGGELASVGWQKNGTLMEGTAQVLIGGGFIGDDEMYVTYDPDNIVDNDGHVYGGGQGKLNDVDENYKLYCNVNNTSVTVQGGKIYGSVFGGGADSHVLGDVDVTIHSGANIGSIGTTSWDGNVFGGGKGDSQVNSTAGRVAGNIDIVMDGGHVMSSIFGGGRQGVTGIDENGDFIDEYHGNVTIAVSGTDDPVYSTIIGIGATTAESIALLESDESVGDIFGSGKGDTDNYEDVLAGRVTNTEITVTGNPRIYGSVFGGGEMAGLGYWHEVNGKQVFYSGTGSSNVTIGTHDGDDNPVIGTEYEFTMPSTGTGHAGNWTVYETIDGVTKLAHTATGNVYGGCQGDVDLDAEHWVSMGRSHDATVNIHGGTIMSNVYGGSEQGTVAGDTEVNMCRGTVGQSLTASDGTTHYNFGSVYGGGYGGTDLLTAHANDSVSGSTGIALEWTGRTYGNTEVNISGGQVYENVYGGGDVASVGWVKTEEGVTTLMNGECTVNVSGSAKIGPLDGTGMNGYVYGGGQGVGNDAPGFYNLYCNVNSTVVTCSLNESGHVYGSLFGGGSDGHVLGNTEVTLEGGTIGTNGTTTWDGNIFGGGRNFLKKNYTAGRVEGNTHVVMNGGTLLGSIFGGGRLAITGINEYGVMQEGTAHGNTLVEVTGGTVGNSALMETWTTSTMGDVYGGGKGDMVGLSDHPVASAMLVALVKNTVVNITGTARIYGKVYGGGEVANVGDYDWDVNSNNQISNIHLKAGGLTQVTISGGVIGAERMRMDYTLTEGVGNYSLKYNTDVGHVFGGGEGRNYDPEDHNLSPIVDAEGNSLVDLMATVGSTVVTVCNATNSGGTVTSRPWVKGSVYGGGENGHVLGNTEVNIDGGQIGAGNNTAEDKDDLYKDGENGTPNQFINPLTDINGDVTSSQALYECVSWPYDSLTNRPFDVIRLKADQTYTPSDGKSWFGQVFGGGSGYYPFIRKVTQGEQEVYEEHWNHMAGHVGGTATVNITGGHILTSVYGGCELTSVGTYGIADDTYHTQHPDVPVGALYHINGGAAYVNMSGGTLGVPRTIAQIKAHPVTCYLFGAGKGDPRTDFNRATNVASATVEVTGGTIYGSIFGGGEEGHVTGDVSVTVNQSNTNNVPTIIGTTGRSYVDGNIFGGGRGFSGEALTAGVVCGNVGVNIGGGTMLGSIYGGGRLASVGTYLVPADNDAYGTFQPGDDTHGKITVTITGGTIGNDYESYYHHSDHTKGGNVFTGAMGRLTLLNGNVNTNWPRLGMVKKTILNISGTTTVIKGKVYGGGEFGTVEKDARVTVSGGTIWSSVYGGGRGSSDYTITSGVANSPMQLAGRVGGDTYVTMEGGWIKKNIYGGGELATVGVIQNDSVKHVSETTTFALSWPYKMNYTANTGKTDVKVKGGRVGITGYDYMGPWNTSGVPYNPTNNQPLTQPQIDAAMIYNGSVYGGGKGFADNRYLEAHSANVRTTDVTIQYSNDDARPNNYNTVSNGVYTYDCVAGAVYGGGENGHVIGDAKVEVKRGLVGHSVYGAGRGTDVYEVPIWKIGTDHNAPADSSAMVNSITAGKVYGNTTINMTGGYVVRNVYGGGYMASVGKGNYAGGASDYSYNGYGERVTVLATFKADTLNSGHTYVNVTGGQVGYLDPEHPSDLFIDNLPYGNVFGGSHGIVTRDVPRDLTPRIYYCPEDFLGYVNHGHVVIGNATGSDTGPRIYGSVYGGGMDGHVRWNTHVMVNKGEIGADYGQDAVNSSATINSPDWALRGNVFGAGSGIGEYEDSHHVKHYSYISGSVTHFAKVTINGGTIHNCVYGGGNLATVGPPRIFQDHDCRSDSTGVVLKIGGTAKIGLNHDMTTEYGGRVYGASRGIASDAVVPVTFTNSGTINKPKYRNFALCSYTDVTVEGNATIYGAVFGGGENGQVGCFHEKKTTGVEDGQNIHNTLVNIKGGTVKHSVYGGGQGVYDPVSSSPTYYMDSISGRVLGSTTVNLMGGTIGVDNGNYAAAIYGGCRNANIWGNTNVNVGSRTTRTDTFEGNVTIYGSVYGANNQNGTPYGNVNVDVYSTAHTGQPTATGGNSYPTLPDNFTTMSDQQKLYWLSGLPKNKNNFAIYQVFGGSNEADYKPKWAGSKARVKVWQCDKNTIFDVYGGSNAAAIGTTGTPSEANVIIEGGRMNRVFGGGNGNPNPADVHGPANTTVNAGLINELYGGSNNQGLIDVINLVVNPEGTCAQVIGDVFGGGNEALVVGDVITTVECCDAVYGNFYCGTNLATIYGNVTGNIFGAKYENLFAGSKGQLASANVEAKPADIRRFPVDETELNSSAYPEAHRQAILNYLTAHPTQWGTGGNVTLNIFGGTIGNAFGGSDENGNIEGKIQVNVYNVGGTCNLDLTNLYGAGKTTDYRPNYNVASGQQRLTPEINVIHGTVKGSVYGGGLGWEATTEANPVVNIGYTAAMGDASHGLVKKLNDTVAAHSATPPAPANYFAKIEHDVFGGGNEGQVEGNTYVNLVSGEVGVLSSGSLSGGCVYGGGQGATSAFGPGHQLISGTENYGRVMGNTYVNISGSAHILKEVYGGGQMGSVGSGLLNKTTGVTHVTISGGEIGPYVAAEKNANVFGGGQGYIGEDLSYYTNHANVDSTSVIITGTARIHGNVFGGSGNGHVLAGTHVQVKDITSSTATIGTSGLTGEEGHVYGGGQGTAGSFTAGRVGGCTKVEISDGKILGCVFGGGRMALTGVDEEGSFDTYVDDDEVYDTIHHGTTEVVITGGVIGTNASEGLALLTSNEVSGNVYGAGRGEPEEHIEDDWGRVAKSVLTISGSPTIYGSVYGGGQMANVGHWLDYADRYAEGTSATTVNIIGSPTIGTAKEFTQEFSTYAASHSEIKKTLYENINGKRMLVHSRTGNVYGSGQGDVKLRAVGKWDGHPIGFEQGHCGKTFVNILPTESNSPTIMGSVFGGAEQGAVWGNTRVEISGGTIGTVTNTDDSNDKNNYAFGSVFGGSYGKDAYIHLGLPDAATASYGVPMDSIPILVDSINGLSGHVYGNTRVIITGGTIRENVFGGGDMASVGDTVMDGHGNVSLVEGTGKCTVSVSGKAIVGPLDGTGLNGYVYGGGKGIGNDPDNKRKTYCNVHETDVTVNLSFEDAFDDDHISRPNRWSSTTDGRIYGSIFGGGADGHTLCDAKVTLQSGLIGTDGTTSWDGNIFGGGRNFLLTNYTAGRVGGNVTVEMTGGHLLGSLYGGGRNAITGLGEDVITVIDPEAPTVAQIQTLQDDTDPTHPEHGKITVMVKGGFIGNNTLTGTNSDDPTESFVETFSDYSMGSVYGGGKGTLDGIVNHPKASALLISMVKETDVQISQENPNVPTHIYGIVFGGGEMASVGNCTWEQNLSTHAISKIDMKEGTGLAKVTISGGIIGADRAKMRWEPGTGDYAMYPKYNDDLGYVYGGGEGYSDDPLKEEGGHRVYPDVSTAHFGVLPILDIMASVNNTEVNISGGWVKASVFGGAEAGHVFQNTKVNISGGQIGAGHNSDPEDPADKLYAEADFIDPVVTKVTTTNSLYGTYHWDYESPYRPYDPAEIANHPTTYEPTDGKSWFGNVFGGGSGWFPYIKNISTTNVPEYKSFWNANSGKVWGNTVVNITGGHILNNVYGANEATDVGGKATVKMSGGTVGVPRTPTQVGQQPTICYVFGGGAGDQRTDFNGINNAASTDVRITGGIIYGSVFGGAEDGHVLGDVLVTVKDSINGTEPTSPIIGSTGKSGADGNLFCGGRNFMGTNLKAGRVEGNITLNMSGGTFLGSVFGGGRYAITGIDENGDMKDDVEDDPLTPEVNEAATYGYTDITISGGVVGNAPYLNVANTPNLYTNDAYADTLAYIGHVYASGKGDAKDPDLGRVKNASATITGSAEVLGNVYGGGEMSNVGWYNVSQAGDFSCVAGTGDAHVTISGGQVGFEQYGIDQVKIIGGSVYGGGKGVPGGPSNIISGTHSAVAYGNVGNSLVTIDGGYITNSVFGGGQDGHVFTHSVVNMSDGIVGQKNTVNELEVDEYEQFAHGYIYTGSVLGGGRGTTPLSGGTFSDMTGRVFGNATVTISGGTVRRAVYGGGGLATVGTTNTTDSDGLPVFDDGTGTCTVTITGGHIGPSKADMAGYSPADSTKFFKNLGGNSGLVFGAGCGLAGHSTLTFNNLSIVNISGNNTQIVGAVYGGGETAHVKTNTNVTISGGTIGGIPLHGSGWVSGTGAFAGVNFRSDVDELAEDEYGAGSRVYHGNVYGGGKGTDFVDKVNKIYSPTAGVVYGNTNVTISGGTIYNRVFGGGSLASVGIYNTETVGESGHELDSIKSLKSGGTCTVTISGGQIGTDGNNNGDVFGGGRGLVGRHWDRWHQYNDQVVFLAYVGNTDVTIEDGAVIKSNVYGGSANGHVMEDAEVTVNGGIIGIPGHGGWHSNVYGGGGGQHQYTKPNNTTHHSITSGRVFGNTNVSIFGGTIYHNVYGGGAIASVGTYNIYATDPSQYVLHNSGQTVVTVTGGVIGTDGDENGMVFGSGRGKIAAIDDFMDSLSYVVKTTVTIGSTTATSNDYPQVKGSVYGSGENGHTFMNTQVNVHSGTIGCTTDEFALMTSSEIENKFPYRGNVYGAGCGTDLIDEAVPTSYNPRSGMVTGNTEVNITGGHISHNVYGGGAMALVGNYDAPANPGWDNNAFDPGSSKAVINITGGTIGTSNAPTDVEHGCVFGGSRGPNSGNGFTNMALVDQAFVNIDEAVSAKPTNILGNVFGGGEKSRVMTSRVVNINGGTVEQSVFGGSMNGLTADSYFDSPKTVNMRGGLVKGNVFGCSLNANEGTALGTWTSFVNISGGTIGITGDDNGEVFAAGNGGAVNGSVCVNIGAEAILKSGTLTNNANIYINKTGGDDASDPSPKPLRIKGNVYGGSHHYGDNWNSNFNKYDITGSSAVFIDGTDYNTGTTTSGNTMNLDQGVYGSGKRCESGKTDRKVYIRNYGERTSSESGELSSVSRTLTTIQRGGTVLLDDSHIKFSGLGDISTTYNTDLQLAIFQVDDGLYVTNGSSIVMGDAGAPVYMDSIHQVRSLWLNVSGEVHNSYEAGSSDWEMVGLVDGDSTQLYRIQSTAALLDKADENVIIFNGRSKLWVRYHDKATGGTKYGELYGFFRMRSPLLPRGTETFAEARPKLTENVNPIVGYTIDNENNPTGNTWNKGDGGFLSYNKDYNYFTRKGETILGFTYPKKGDDGGDEHTRSKQYPYYNVTVAKKGVDNVEDLVHYREWVLPIMEGKPWYVDGRGIGNGGWGKDGNHQLGWGHYPDMPKLTLTAPYDATNPDNIVYGGILNDVSTTPSNGKAVFNMAKDVIFVVGPVYASREDTHLNLSMLATSSDQHFELKLYRYPGGHPMSNEHTDGTTGTAPVPSSSYNGLKDEPALSSMDPDAGPGANLGAMILANKTADFVLDSVIVDGLYSYSTVEATELNIPSSYATAKMDVSEPLVVTTPSAHLTLTGGTTLKRGYNNTDASGTVGSPSQRNFYKNPDFNDATVHNGGAMYVDATAIVNVGEMVTINDSKQKNGTGEIPSNVYLPTFGTYLNVIDTLAKDTKIGITNPIRNKAASYEYNTLSPVAVVVDSDPPKNAADTACVIWNNDNFVDDLSWFFGNGSKSAYYDNLGYEGGSTEYRTLYFGWTWANVVREAPAGFNVNDLNSPEDMAWLISLNKGMNGVTTTTNFSGQDLVQTADIDMKQYVWVPIGDSIPNMSIHKPFTSSYDGRGHLIKNLSIDYIGKGDTRYEIQNYGLFGYVRKGSVDRTFVVSGVVKPNITGDHTDVGVFNVGGLVGCLNSSTVTNSEAALNITCPNVAGTSIVTGGLVANMVSGTIHSSMAMPWMTTRTYSNGYVGGLVGSAVAGNIFNSFVNGQFVLNGTPKAGGLMGHNTGATMENCYVNWGPSDPSNTIFNGVVKTTSGGSIDYCYAKKVDGEHPIELGNAGEHSRKFTPTISADRLGYMYQDNKVEVQAAVGTTPAKYKALFQLLNQWAYDHNTTSDSTYAHWARPGLAEINGDYPVLLLNEFNGDRKYQGKFRSVGTYARSAALQYGGPVRDGEADPEHSIPANEIVAALTREKDGTEKDCLFIYGDVTGSITISSEKATITQDKVSIHEDASIEHPNNLNLIDDVYVGVTFDNSYGKATSTPFMNHGLVGMGGFLLPRDWHMFSTPLSNAPLGFNYMVDAVNTNEQSYGTGDAGAYYNNPWVSTTNEFSWLNGGHSGDNRYWMKDYDDADGYFPTEIDESVTPLGDDLFIVNTPETPSDECPASGRYRYPYGMDFYTWTEPDYHWINFKRNGPNHWHSDVPHVHLDYQPVVGATTNKNEDELIVGRGYMAAITKETFMQSHGTLNNGYQTIPLTNNGWFFAGWNLVGNPYHGYIDFDKMVDNSITGSGYDNYDILAKKDDTNPFYVVYNADAYSSTGGAGTAFRYYTPSCSKGGEYALQYLHPHQGFYVRAEHAGDLKFDESFLVDRDVVKDKGDFRDDRPAYPLVNLYLSSDQGCADVTVIEFERPEWGGAQKLKELRVGDGLFYAHHDGTYYAALFAQEGIDRVPLWFEAKEDDIFTMKWNTANADFHSMYLIDNINGIHYDMLMNDTYTFEGHKGDYPSRFLIVFNLTGVEELEDEPSVFAFHNGTEWIVTGEGLLQFIDVNGQVLWQDRLGGGQSRVSLPWVAEGPYLFRLINSQETKVQKVIVRH